MSNPFIPTFLSTKVKPFWKTGQEVKWMAEQVEQKGFVKDQAFLR